MCGGAWRSRVYNSWHIFNEVMNCQNRTYDAKGQVGQEHVSQGEKKNIPIHLTVPVQSKHVF